MWMWFTWPVVTTSEISKVRFYILFWGSTILLIMINDMQVNHNWFNINKSIYRLVTWNFNWLIIYRNEVIITTLDARPVSYTHLFVPPMRLYCQDEARVATCSGDSPLDAGSKQKRRGLFLHISECFTLFWIDIYLFSLIFRTTHIKTKVDLEINVGKLRLSY